jgi:hypothetical protein
LSPPHTWSWAHAPAPLQLPTSTHPHPVLVVPLQEVAGVEGTVRVHVPFSMTDMSQIEQRLGSFLDNPTRYCKEFLYLTWGDIYSIINDTLMEGKKERIWKAAEKLCWTTSQ